MHHWRLFATTIFAPPLSIISPLHLSSLSVRDEALMVLLLCVWAGAACRRKGLKVMASPASPFAISEASGICIPKAAVALPVGWRGHAGGCMGKCNGNRSIRYSTIVHVCTGSTRIIA